MTSQDSAQTSRTSTATGQNTGQHTGANAATDRSHGSRIDVALLVLRLGLGVVMLAHGLQKFGQGIDSVVGFFGSVGIPLPAIAAPMVAGLETIGGIALILGVLTRIAAALLAVSCTVAMFTVHLAAGFYAADGGYELVLILALALVSIVIAGPGRFTVVGGVRGIPALLR